MIELPQQDPCEICAGMAGREDCWAVVAESELTLTVVNPYQFETGQCCVITRRHVATLLDLTNEEGAAVIEAAREVARALLAAYEPLGILTFQNNGVYSGQVVPHYHFHVVPRQNGSDWGIGPPQLQRFPSAGRVFGTPHDSSTDEARLKRAKVDAPTLGRTAQLIRENLPK
jgi:diadenosine tetraphosphate (Ap4A) HIT family hydrolase